jgi:NADPH2 dehydrogenase
MTTERFFDYKTLEDIRAASRELDVDVSFEDELDAVFRPVKIADRTIGNSMGIHPMEGCDGTLDGRPGELTVRRWRRFGEGGAKLIWGEATAVVPEGLANPRQLLINEENMKSLADLVRETRIAHRTRFGFDGDLLVGLQLTHSGRYSYRKPLIAYHHPQVDQATYLDKANGIRIPQDYPVLSDDDLERLEDAYVKAARRAFAVGFDFIDIKQCHTYLLNELLGARTRRGKYGGDFEGRTRFIRNTLGKIRSNLGNSALIASRLNVFDGVPFRKDPVTGVGVPVPYEIPYRYSFGIRRENPLMEDLKEPIELIRLMRSYGVSMVNVSMGSPYYNMHYGRPFERSPDDGYFTPEHPLVGVARHFRVAGAIQQTFPDLVVVGTGYSWLRQFLLNAGEWNLRNKRVTIVATGRGAIAYPDYASDALRDGALKHSRVCLAISYCTNLMRAKNNELGQYPAGCVPRDEIYTAVYKELLASRAKPRPVHAKP